MERILHQLSRAIISAINRTRTQRKYILRALRDLVKLENRPWCLTEMAYEWCSVICRTNQSLGDWENVLLVSLEIGFRRLDFQRLYISARLTHTKHHRKLIDVVFKSRKSEAIADLLLAWTTTGYHLQPHALLGDCTGHLVNLHGLLPSSSRLRRLVIRSVELIGYKGFEGVGVERFTGLLDHLHVTTKDMDEKVNWAKVLLDTLQTPEGARHLSHWYWKLLVELATSESESRWMREALVGTGVYGSEARSVREELTYNPQIIAFLTGAQEWNKLECWMVTVWMLWPPGASGMTEEDFGHSMLLLFRQRPGAAQELEQRMEQWSQRSHKRIPESFQRICRQAHGAAQLDAP
jgi:hypothetical protein